MSLATCRVSVWQSCCVERRIAVVNEAIHTPLAAWESFYIIVGPAGGALTGLQFVVMALIADSRTRTDSPAIAAFGTPTILHFSAALLVSALLSAPWLSLAGPGLAVTACGIAGSVYTLIVIKRARKQQAYRPVLEDWVWHAVLPLLSYVTLLAGGVLLPRDSGPALFLVGTATLVLVFIGIHNAWDSITYIAIDLPQQRRETEKPQSP